MIDIAMASVVSALNEYLNLRSPSIDPDRIVAGSLFKLDGMVNDKVKDKVVMSVVNVEEDRVYHSVEVFDRHPDGTSTLVQPEVKVNLYVLFVANFDTYSEALKALSHVISFFQHRRTVDVAGLTTDDDTTARIAFDLYSLTFEQQNHLWGALGAKYTPSVLYKVGIVEISDEQIVARVRPVEEIRIEAGEESA